MPLEMMSAPRLEAPWDRLEFQEQSNVEAYCAELDRMLSMCHDGHAFVEHVAALDQRFQEAWFSTKFGDRHADPMQAFRQVPTGGVVHGPRTNASALGAQGSEILQRHASLLENRYPRPSVTPRFEAAAGAGAFSRPTAAGPSRCRESAGGEVQQTVHSSCCRLAKLVVSFTKVAARLSREAAHCLCHSLAFLGQGNKQAARGRRGAGRSQDIQHRGYTCRAASPRMRQEPSPPSPRCGYCGSQVPAAASFCSHCGCQQEAERPWPRPPPPPRV
ncbi:unnamed protein product [Effrenium voratum]|nr:unnamed protein product [Effrenium voratum]